MEKALAKLGLTNSEIKVYSALLDLESTTVGPIIERSKVSSSKIYDLLNKLKEKGLVTYVIRNNVRHYQVSDPQNILALLDEREQDIREQKKNLRENILPRLHAKAKPTHTLTVYESVEGFKAGLRHIFSVLHAGEEYCVFLPADLFRDERLRNAYRQFQLERMERGIRVKILAAPELKEEYKKISWKYAQVRVTRQKLPVGVVIFKDHVLTFVYGNPVTMFIVQSRRHYEVYKEFFDEIWKKAK